MAGATTITLGALALGAAAFGVPQTIEARKARIAARRASEDVIEEGRRVRAEEAGRRKKATRLATQRKLKRRGARGITGGGARPTILTAGADLGVATEGKTLLGE